ncbi:hypothetical protein TCAL_05787 [Tigriopus californicus]|uniref:Uncharacterized protein n=1 Tax=Tigriopus californicus TaxID=6832 RepID=A0A553PQG4_TIGCA|nr:uncharacterized protein LOC131882308 [Tigriopus californicus]XP_059085394.1 uncharacterized protein LOC131882308 [Tigriopus californicus]TRY79924.1 hypothetical protein TCAL_05787 [Tigriopus californicus]|eukprot:TCALIF_05787-PA protein Name:"Similar to LCP1 Larval cuticle protein 1 (Helicoverpa armigera)" AED:0.24 eAED:0.24 QI:132/1/0.5/1/1/1/2/0/411
MKRFVALITLAMSLVSNAQIRYVRDSTSYANVGGNTRSAATLVELKPIAIVRSVFNGPTGDKPDFDFSYETENGIKQEATGTMKDIDGTEVMVMRGSYSYIDENGDDVLVSWVADEMGFRAESESLPIAPEIPFPDQAEAVAAQIRFAQEERARNANSGSPTADTSYTSSSSQEPQVFAARASTGYGAAPASEPVVVASRAQSLNQYSRATPQEPQVFAARTSTGYGAAPASEPVVVASRAQSLNQYSRATPQEPQVFAARTSTGYGAAPASEPVVVASRAQSLNQYSRATPQEPQVFAARASPSYRAAPAPEPVVVASRDQSRLGTYSGFIAEADVPTRGIALVEVAEPTVVVEDRLADYKPVEPVVQIAREFEAERLPSYAVNINERERVAPVEAKSRKQPAYIQYLLE